MKIPVEKAFDEFVREYGGVVVRDTLEKSPAFNNADYVFHKHRVVAELKCLEEDKLEDPVLMGKMKDAWDCWREKGWVTGEIPGEIRGDQIPQQCFEELRTICSNQIKRTIKKANRQIRETKANLGLTEYRGLLLLCNDGNFALPPLTLMNFMAKALCHDYSEIGDFVLFSVNMKARIPNVAMPCDIWLSGAAKGKSLIEPEIMSSIHTAWHAYLEGLHGKPLKSYGTDEVHPFPV